MKILVLVFLFVGAVFADQDVGSGTGSVCENNPDQVCRPEEFIEDFYTRETLFPNDDFLKKHCSNVIEAINCLIDFDRQCAKSSIDLDPHGLVTLEKMRNITQVICDKDSAVGEAYRSSISCVNGAIINLQRAAEVSSLDISHFHWFVRREKPHVEGRHFLCFGMKLFSTAINSAVTQACGEDPGIVVKAIVQTIMADCPPEEEMEELNLLYGRFTLERFLFKRK